MSGASVPSVRLKLFASLRSYLPAVPQGQVDLPLQGAFTPAQLIAAHAIPPDAVHLILVNGVYVAPEDADTRQLQSGDEVALWPPVAGG